MKKKIISLCLVVCLLAIAIVGGTMAYFTDTDEDTNVFTAGTVDIVQEEKERNDKSVQDFNSYNLVDFEDYEHMVPAVPADGETEITWSPDANEVEKNYEYQAMPNGGQSKVFSENVRNEVDKIVYVHNDSNVYIYAATLVCYEDTNDVSTNFAWAGGEFPKAIKVEGNILQYRLNDEVFTVALSIYNEKIAPEGNSTPCITQVAMVSDATQETIKDLGADRKWTVECVSLGVQADGFDDAATAIDAAFGVSFTDMTVEEAKELVKLIDADAVPGYYTSNGFVAY